jgi:ribosomal 50S subunit-associated protein YjgA (DUF615 family)
MTYNDFIGSIDNKLYNKIRQSKSDAECRRYLKEHLQKQLHIHDVVDCKNDLDELYIAHNWHNEQMKEVEPLSRDYFIHYGRREGVRNAIEIITGEEM